LLTWVRSLAAAAAALAGLSGCGEPEPPAPRPSNVLLISIDTLRADHLGSYGYERDTSPFLDRLAAEGVVFEHAHSTAPLTAPAHASLLSGLYPRKHQVRSFGPSVPTRYGTLASLLGEQGYATAAVVNMAALAPMQRGFERWMLVPHARGSRATGRMVAARALASLEESALPYFLFLHFYDVHSDYDPRPEYVQLFAESYDGPATGATRQLSAFRTGEIQLGLGDARHLMNLYDAGIRQLDDELARLFQELESGGHLEDTLLVITSDHGEEFLEHGSFLHGRTLHQELVRVPLIFWGAGVPAGVRIEQPVSLVDVLPTLLTRVGAPLPEHIDGIDVSALWWLEDPAASERPIFAEADNWIANEDRNFRRAVRLGPWTLHYDAESDSAALYDLRSDPLEQRDRSGENPQLAAQLRLALARFLPRSQRKAPPPPPAELLETLRQLGYLEAEESP